MHLKRKILQGYPESEQEFFSVNVDRSNHLGTEFKITIHLLRL